MQRIIFRRVFRVFLVVTPRNSPHSFLRLRENYDRQPLYLRHGAIKEIRLYECGSEKLQVKLAIRDDMHAINDLGLTRAAKYIDYLTLQLS